MDWKLIITIAVLLAIGVVYPVVVEVKRLKERKRREENHRNYKSTNKAKL